MWSADYAFEVDGKRYTGWKHFHIFSAESRFAQIRVGGPVTVYYKPGRITEKELLASIRKNRCARAALVRGKGISVIMNPVIAAGDAVQVRVEVTEVTTLKSVNLPPGWQLITPSVNAELPKGTHFIVVQSPKRTANKAHTISVVLGDGSKVTGEVAVVNQVGKH